MKVKYQRTFSYYINTDKLIERVDDDSYDEESAQDIEVTLELLDNLNEDELAEFSYEFGTTEISIEEVK